MKKINVKLILLITSCLTFSCKSSEQMNVWMIGDSTMAQKKPNTTERGWGMSLSKFVDTAQVRIANYGKNGRSTKSFIDEGWWTMVLDSLQPGDFVLIQFGHNDEKIDAPLHTDAATTYRDYLKKFVDETREKGATPILLTSIVRRNFDANKNLVDSHGVYPQATRETARKLNVLLIDTELKTRLLESIAGWEGTHDIHQYEPPGEIDNTHLCNFGAYIVARMVAEGVRQQDISIPLNSAPDTLTGTSDNTLDLAYQYFSDNIQLAQMALESLSSVSGADDFFAAIDSAQSIYNKGSFRTLEDIDEATRKLHRAERIYRWTQSVPFDATFAVGNASFEEGTGWNSAVGANIPLAWQMEAKLIKGHIGPDSKNTSDGYYCYSITTDEGSSIHFYQDVNLPIGYYLLTVDLTLKTGNAVKLYAKVGDQMYDTLATGSESTWENTSVKFSVPADNSTIRLGVSATAAMIIDNFKLTKIE